MTKKRFIKLVMSLGISRNRAKELSKKVEPYCHDCNEFEHECQTCANEYWEPSEFIIRCKYASKCENICNYLKSQGV